MFSLQSDKELAKELIVSHLVRYARGSTSNKNLTMALYAIQELLKFLGCKDDGGDGTLIQKHSKVAPPATGRKSDVRTNPFHPCILCKQNFLGEGERADLAIVSDRSARGHLPVPPLPLSQTGARKRGRTFAVSHFPPQGAFLFLTFCSGERRGVAVAF